VPPLSRVPFLWISRQRAATSRVRFSFLPSARVRGTVALLSFPEPGRRCRLSSPGARVRQSRFRPQARRPAPKLLRRRAPVRVSTFPASTPPGADFGFDSTCGSGSSFSFLRTFDSPGQVCPVDLILL
jgi:hypothetical protein